MNEQISPSISRLGRGLPIATSTNTSTGRQVEEVLPFTVSIVKSEEDLAKAVRIRHSAYARHVPEFAETLREAEASDTEPGVVVFLAKSKLDGSPLGTIRIQTNQYKPLCMEQSVELPDWLRPLRLAEATRLGVTDGKFGRLITTVMCKAFYLYCKQIGAEWMVITGRSPIDRQYERILFEDVFPDRGYIPMPHVGNLPHRVMASCVETAEARWTAARHPLFDFVFRSHHPDIIIDTEHLGFFSPMHQAPRVERRTTFSM